MRTCSWRVIHPSLPESPSWRTWKVQGGLPGRVPRADDKHVLTFTGHRLGDRRAVVHPCARESFDAGRVELAVRHAGRDEQRVATDLGTAGKVDDTIGVLRPNALRLQEARVSPRRTGWPGPRLASTDLLRSSRPGIPGSSRSMGSCRPVHRVPHFRRVACRALRRLRTPPPPVPPDQRQR